MTIQVVGFDTIVSNQDWKYHKFPLEVLLLASPPIGSRTSFLGYIDGDYKSPLFVFKRNSIVRIRGGALIFDTEDIIKPKFKPKK